MTDGLDSGIAHFNARRLEKARAVFASLVPSPDPRPSLFLAYTLAELGRPADAAACLRALLQRQPRCTAGLVALGKMQARLGRTGEAEALFRKAGADAEARACLAELLYQRQDFAAARRACAGAVALAPRDPRLRCAMARIAAAQGDLKAAATAFERAAALDRGSSDAWSGLGSVRAAQGDLERAEKAFRNATQARPNDIAAQVSLGRVLERRGRADEAERLYRAAIRAQPSAPEAHRALGECLLTRGKFTAARAAFNAALARDGSNLQDVRGLAGAALGLRQWKEAERLYGTVLRKEPGAREAHRGLGESLLAQQRFPAARAAFRKALDIDGARPQVLLGLARAELGSRRYAEAAEYFRRALDVSPGSDEARYGLGRALLGRIGFAGGRDFADSRGERDWEAAANEAEIVLSQGRYEEAFQRMDAVVARLRGVDKAEALAWRGALRLWRREYRQALADLEPAVRGGAAFAPCWRGAARLMLGKRPQALADFDAALFLKPHDQEALVWRGEVKRLEGRHDDAAADLGRALELRPDNPFALANRALLRLERGDRGGALADLKKMPRRLVGDAARGGVRAGRAVLQAILDSAGGVRRFEPHHDAWWLTERVRERLKRLAAAGALVLALGWGTPVRAESDRAHKYYYEEIFDPFFRKEGNVYKAVRPGAQASSFSVVKSSSAYRVFVLGGSIASLLSEGPGPTIKEKLQQLYPDRSVELINCGMAGYDSAREALIEQEVLEYQPDLLIFLTGHNEGLASPPVPVWILEAQQRLSTFSAFRKLAASFRKEESAGPPNLTRRNLKFAANLRQNIRQAKERGVAVAVVVPPINYGVPPQSYVTPYDGVVLGGWLKYIVGDSNGALAEWENAVDRLPRQGEGSSERRAVLLQLQGRLEERLGGLDAAEADLKKAVATDESPFCGPGCGQIIASIAKEEGASVADGDGLFRKLTGRRLPGMDVFNDRMHWKPRYNCALSAAIAASLVDPARADLDKLLAGCDRPGGPQKLSDDEKILSYVLMELSWPGEPKLSTLSVHYLDALRRSRPEWLDDVPALAKRVANPNLDRVYGRGTAPAETLLPRFYWHVGEARLLAQDPRQAIRDLREAVRLDPKACGPKLSLAVAEKVTGEIIRAQALLREAAACGGADAFAAAEALGLEKDL